jgi:hypothetical protein
MIATRIWLIPLVDDSQHLQNWKKKIKKLKNQSLVHNAYVSHFVHTSICKSCIRLIITFQSHNLASENMVLFPSVIKYFNSNEMQTQIELPNEVASKWGK